VKSLQGLAGAIIKSFAGPKPHHQDGLRDVNVGKTEAEILGLS